MTLSATRRRRDQDYVLKTFATELGDGPMARKWWDIDREDFAALIPTTWTELTERGLIIRHQRNNPPPAFELTEAGWVEGLRLAGTLDDEGFRGRCIALVQYFKSQVEGRRAIQDALLSHHEVGKHFPLFWVLNVLKSGLLEELFPGKRMNARWDSRQNIVRVPVTFGMPE